MPSVADTVADERGGNNTVLSSSQITMAAIEETTAAYAAASPEQLIQMFTRIGEPWFPNTPTQPSTLPSATQPSPLPSTTDSDNETDTTRVLDYTNTPPELVTRSNHRNEEQDIITITLAEKKRFKRIERQLLEMASQLKLSLQACGNKTNGCPRRETISCGFSVCSLCDIVGYCSVECQVEHWRTHRKGCAPILPLFCRRGARYGLIDTTQVSGGIDAKNTSPVATAHGAGLPNNPVSDIPTSDSDTSDSE
jgi:hypothetical protein